MYHLHPELELISEQQQVRLTKMPCQDKTTPWHLCHPPQQGLAGAQGADAVENQDKDRYFFFVPCELENFSLSILTVRHGK